MFSGSRYGFEDVLVRCVDLGGLRVLKGKITTQHVVVQMRSMAVLP